MFSVRSMKYQQNRSDLFRVVLMPVSHKLRFLKPQVAKVLIENFLRKSCAGKFHRGTFHFSAILPFLWGLLLLLLLFYMNMVYNAYKKREFRSKYIDLSNRLVFFPFSQENLSSLEYVSSIKTRALTVIDRYMF